MQQVFRREGRNLYYYSNKTKKFSLDSWYLPQLHLLESKGNKKSKAATTNTSYILPRRDKKGILQTGSTARNSNNYNDG